MERSVLLLCVITTIMAATMQPTTLIQKENWLHAEFDVRFDYYSPTLKKSHRTSPKYYISGITQFQVRCDMTYIHGTYDFRVDVFIKIENLHQDEDFLYSIEVSSRNCNLEDKVYIIDETEWRLVHSFMKIAHSYKFSHVIDISVVLGLVKTPSLFKSLSNDDEATDFTLRARDGGVDVHRAVLAAHSPVMRTMLQGEWKETAEGVVQVSGATKETLEHLRDYMYLHQLPDQGLEKLLALAARYMMPELMKLCSVNMLFKLNDENHVLFMELATRYKLKTLFLGIQESVKQGLVKPIAKDEYFDADDWI